MYQASILKWLRKIRKKLLFIKITVVSIMLRVCQRNKRPHGDTMAVEWRLVVDDDGGSDMQPRTGRRQCKPIRKWRIVPSQGVSHQTLLLCHASSCVHLLVNPHTTQSGGALYDIDERRRPLGGGFMYVEWCSPTGDPLRHIAELLCMTSRLKQHLKLANCHMTCVLMLIQRLVDQGVLLTIHTIRPVVLACTLLACKDLFDVPPDLHQIVSALPELHLLDWRWLRRIEYIVASNGLLFRTIVCNRIADYIACCNDSLEEFPSVHGRLTRVGWSLMPVEHARETFRLEVMYVRKLDGYFSNKKY